MQHSFVHVEDKHLGLRRVGPKVDELVLKRCHRGTVKSFANIKKLDHFTINEVVKVLALLLGFFESLRIFLICKNRLV